MSILHAAVRLATLRVLLCLSLPLTCMPAATAAPPAISLPTAGISSATNHPNLLLDLSVEYPTVGSAYPRQSYVASRAYVGYFDPSRCYVYTSPTTYALGVYSQTNDVNHYFKPAGMADASHRCNGKFSGNFMNWAAASAIDILRLAMTGGDRVVDEVGKTVLQRAYLPPGFYASPGNFPVVSLTGSTGLTTRDVTPFSVPVLYVTSCRNRILFSSAAPLTMTSGTSDDTLCDAQNNPDKALGEFLVRVEVCSSAEGPIRSDLCHKYGQHYKPEGEIQRNAEKMRFAAFGYLYDNDPKRYGGVLRAAMKYVGPNSFDAALQPSSNPNAEWDPGTGIFKTDPSPDGAGTGISGVINYLNKFGRSGAYKTLDPVAELFYESIRYLQGLQPTPDAIANMTSPMKDGFPVVTQWADPIQASCQKNSVLVIADAHTHFEFNIPGNTRTVFLTGTSTPIIDGPRPIDTTSTPPLDIMAFTHKIGVMETTAHGVDTTTRPQLANLENQMTGAGAPGTFEGSYYFSGLAYWANTSALRNDAKKQISAQTYVIDVDEYGSGVITDDNIRPLPHPRDSQLYLAAKYGAFQPEKNPAIPHDPTDPFWPLPTAASQKSGAHCYPYLWDPNGTCDPPNYLLASDGGRFLQAVRNVFAQQVAPGEALTQVGASSTVVREGTGQFIYQGKFFSPSWAGDVRRLPVTYDPATGLTIGAADAKTPTAILKEPDWPVPAAGPPVLPRKIYTYGNPATPAANSTLPFDWASLKPAQQAILNDTDMLGEARLHYLRGATNNEQGLAGSTGTFRQRPKAAGITNVLGDIVHSNPVYVGAPSQSVQGAGYQSFYAAHATRPAAVYVGANDGMLHAFNADLSQEYFAYVPGMTFAALPALTRPDYQHRAYVDGGITVAEAKVGGNWKTVLASAMGGGAQGIFALDVSDPQNFSSTSGALWEFSDADDVDMGNVFSPPTIAKFTRSISGGVPNYEYFVVVSSGVNNYVADGAVSAAPGGALFLLSLNKPAGVAWQRNANYFKFTIPNSDVDLSQQAGLSAPAMATSNDGAVRAVYAGDLQGQLWRFAFPATAALSAVSPHKLFTARDAAGHRQPITAAPAVAFAPNGGYVVVFGTGKYLESADVHSGVENSMYGIVDTMAANQVVTGRNQLAKRVLAGNAGSPQLSLTGNDFSYVGAQASQGWYIDFADAATTGERLVTAPQLAYGRVIFNTLLPLPVVASCPVASSGRSYSINTLTGLAGASGNSTGALSNVGILSSPIIFTTLAHNAAPVVPNAIGIKAVPRKYSIASIGGNGVLPATNQRVDLTAGRISWREIFNYQGF